MEIKRGDTVTVNGVQGIATRGQYTARNGREYVEVQMPGMRAGVGRRYLAANIDAADAPVPEAAWREAHRDVYRTANED